MKSSITITKNAKCTIQCITSVGMCVIDLYYTSDNIIRECLINKIYYKCTYNITNNIIVLVPADYKYGDMYILDKIIIIRMDDFHAACSATSVNFKFYQK